MARSAKRRRRKNLLAPESLETLLERAGEDRFARKRSPVPMKEWKVIVGLRIADRAHPVTLERGILLIKVTTSVWANELQMLAPELVARLRIRGYAVDQLRFRVGPLDMPDRPPERRATRKVPPPVALSLELKASIAKVADPELRAVIAGAASANLAWQDFVAPSGPASPGKPQPPRPPRPPCPAPTVPDSAPSPIRGLNPNPTRYTRTTWPTRKPPRA